jgi:hypothetical protein
MENYGNRVAGSYPLFKQSDEMLNQELENNLGLIWGDIESPRTLWIMRNAILTILETPDQSFSWKAVHALLTQDDFCTDIVNKLKQVTPKFWREEWDSLWKVDEDPLFSKAQQRIVRRYSLIVFWTEEWSETPKKERIYAAEIIEAL